MPQSWTLAGQLAHVSALPNDVLLLILARVPFVFWRNLWPVCRAWSEPATALASASPVIRTQALTSREIHSIRREKGLQDALLCVSLGTAATRTPTGKGRAMVFFALDPRHQMRAALPPLSLLRLTAELDFQGEAGPVCLGQPPEDRWHSAHELPGLLPRPPVPFWSPRTGEPCRKAYASESADAFWSPWPDGGTPGGSYSERHEWSPSPAARLSVSSLRVTVVEPGMYKFRGAAGWCAVVEDAAVGIRIVRLEQQDFVVLRRCPDGHMWHNGDAYGDVYAASEAHNNSDSDSGDNGTGNGGGNRYSSGGASGGGSGSRSRLAWPSYGSGSGLGGKEAAARTWTEWSEWAIFTSESPSSPTFPQPASWSLYAFLPTSMPVASSWGRVDEVACCHLAGVADQRLFVVEHRRESLEGAAGLPAHLAEVSQKSSCFLHVLNTGRARPISGSKAKACSNFSWEAKGISIAKRLIGPCGVIVV